MKKNWMKVLCLTIALTCMPVSAIAANAAEHGSVAGSEEDTVSPRADIFYYVHKYIGGVRMHRLWNETKGEWVGPWEVCHCK